MGFSRQEYWRGLPCPSPGDLPDPGIKSRSPVVQVDSLPSEPPGKPQQGEKTKTGQFFLSQLVTQPWGHSDRAPAMGTQEAARGLGWADWARGRVT